MPTRNEQGVYEPTGFVALAFYVLGAIAFLVYIITQLSVSLD